MLGEVFSFILLLLLSFCFSFAVHIYPLNRNMNVHSPTAEQLQFSIEFLLKRKKKKREIQTRFRFVCVFYASHHVNFSPLAYSLMTLMTIKPNAHKLYFKIKQDFNATFTSYCVWNCTDYGWDGKFLCAAVAKTDKWWQKV
jgi:hypothetical protein